MKNRFPAILILVASSILVGAGVLPAQDAQSDHGRPEPKMAGVHWAKGQAPNSSGKPSRSPQLLYHGGPILFTTQATAIFWGPSWNNSSFAGDKITGLDTFYSGIGYTPYARTNLEYGDANGKVTDTITYTGHVIDLSPASVNGQQT